MEGLRKKPWSFKDVLESKKSFTVKEKNSGKTHLVLQKYE